MKILHVMPSIDPLLGGPSAVILPMCEALQAQGVDISLITTDSGIVSRPETTIPLICCKASRLSIKEFIPSLQMDRWLRSHVHEFDLIHCHYLFTYSTTRASMLARAHKIPYVLRPLGHCAPWSLHHHSLRKHIYLRLIEHQTLLHAASFHATSQGEADAIRQLLPDARIHTIPLGIDLSSLTLDPNSTFEEFAFPGKFVVLFLGRLHKKKRLELTFDALSLAKTRIPNLQIVIAGNGEDAYTQQLQSHCESLGLTTCTSFLGHIDGEKKKALLARADASLCLSHNENFAVAVAESLAVSCPVLITRGVQLAPLIEQNGAGLICDPDASDAANKLVQLFESSTLREEMGKAGAALTNKRFSWNEISKEMLEMYQEVRASQGVS